MLLFADSFDHYEFFLDKWDAAYGGATQTPNPGDGRFGTSCLATFGDRNAGKNLGGNYDTLFVGVAIRIDQDAPLVTFYDATAGASQLTFHASGGDIRVYRGYTSALIATAASVYTTNVYNYWEFKVVFSQTVGTVTIRKNDVTVLTATGLDTCDTANEYANWLYLGDILGAQNRFTFFDDLVVMDDTDSGVSGAPNNNFLGDVRVEALYPNGNGNSSQLDGSDGNSTDNYLLVDENPDDGDTTYVESGDVGDKDTYTFTNLSSSAGTVYGVQTVFIARKTDAGTRTFATVARVSGTEEDSADFGLGTSYAMFREIREADPLGNQWTLSNVNAAEFGPKITS